MKDVELIRVGHVVYTPDGTVQQVYTFKRKDKDGNVVDVPSINAAKRAMRAYQGSNQGDGRVRVMREPPSQRGWSPDELHTDGAP